MLPLNGFNGVKIEIAGVQSPYFPIGCHAGNFKIHLTMLGKEFTLATQSERLCTFDYTRNQINYKLLSSLQSANISTNALKINIFSKKNTFVYVLFGTQGRDVSISYVGHSFERRCFYLLFFDRLLN